MIQILVIDISMKTELQPICYATSLRNSAKFLRYCFKCSPVSVDTDHQILKKTITFSTAMPHVGSVLFMRFRTHGQLQLLSKKETDQCNGKQRVAKLVFWSIKHLTLLSSSIFGHAYCCHGRKKMSLTQHI